MLFVSWGFSYTPLYYFLHIVLIPYITLQVIRMTYDDILIKRKKLFKHMDRKRVFKRKSHNTETRYCAVCGRPLTSYVFKTGEFVTSVKHIHYYVNGTFLSGSVCYSPHSCYSHLRKEVK